MSTPSAIPDPWDKKEDTKKYVPSLSFFFKVSP